MTDAQTPALLPCPFCGGRDSFSERVDFGSDQRVCNDCGARGPLVDEEGAYEKKNADAVMSKRTSAAWNRRADLSASPAPDVAKAARVLLEHVKECTVEMDSLRANLEMALASYHAAIAS